MKQESQLVAIVILNWNKKDDVLATLKSAFKLDYYPYEVIVVDNASTDGSADAIAETFSQAHLVRNSTNLGTAGGRNIGLKYANDNFDYKYVLFLDEDTVVEKKFLTRLVEAVRGDKKAGIAGGKTYTEFPSKTIMSVGLRVNLYTGASYSIGCGKTDLGQFNKTGYVDACIGCGVFAKREVINQIGGFDNRFNPYSFEDVDFCLRAAKVGYKTLYVPHALIYHKGCTIGRGRIATFERYKVRNYLFVLKRHANLCQKITSLFYIPVVSFFYLVTFLCQGRMDVISARVRGFFEGVRTSHKQ